jgi:hypothetical protein
MYLVTTMSILLAAPAFAANPFLDAKDDKPVSANFRGTEWNDENINSEIPLTARVVTTRIAQMAWGGIFKIEFVDLESRALEKREIRAEYFVVTNDRIVSLNEENNDEAVKKLLQWIRLQPSRRITFVESRRDTSNIRRDSGKPPSL